VTEYRNTDQSFASIDGVSECDERCSMVRTQIPLEPEDVSWLKREARRHGTSLAGVVRQLIRSASEKGSKRVAAAKSLPLHKRRKVSTRFAFVGCIKDGRESDAKPVEDYLYAEGEVR